MISRNSTTQMWLMWNSKNQKRLRLFLTLSRWICKTTTTQLKTQVRKLPSSRTLPKRTWNSLAPSRITTTKIVIKRTTKCMPKRCTQWTGTQRNKITLRRCWLQRETQWSHTERTSYPREATTTQYTTNRCRAKTHKCKTKLWTESPWRKRSTTCRQRCKPLSAP